MTDQNRHRPDETTTQRKQKRGKKAARQPATLPAEAAAPVEALVQEALAAETVTQVTVDITAAEVEAVETTVPETSAPAEVAEPGASTSNLPAVTAPNAPPSPVGLQTIASAYRDYTRKSFADATTFVEKLASARSLDKAVEAQTEFARQACETFATDSRKIRTLYQELFWQSLTFPMWPPGQARR